ncbi:palmitoyltransferase ZDHHC23-like [Lineus longissimus]|uniref:palmitoyltransferase ZDHHC23-like n=1 Tax=Lineus longissimus TaxID=88925 RepID=UPI002B4E7370
MRRYPGDESLCFCEYINDKGDRSHLLACCCDCQALDEAADRVLTCRRLPPELQQKIMTTVQERCRIPWCNGKGAIMVRVDIIVPVIMVPLCLLMATLSWQMSVIILPGMYLFMYLFYRYWRDLAGQRSVSKFFFSWALTSVAFAFYVFETIVISFREVLLWEDLLLVSMAMAMFYMLCICKRRPLHIRNVRSTLSARNSTSDMCRDSSIKVTIEDNIGLRKLTIDDSREGGDEETPHISVIYESDMTWVDSRPVKDGRLVQWCEECAIVRPPRSGHCTVCKMCVEGRDHHCVWINSCIGDQNHRSFLLAWFMLLCVGFYGSHLSLTTICTPKMYLDMFLFANDCRFIYADTYNALAFVTTIYILSATVLLTCGFIFQQCLLISQNVTNQEFHRARILGRTKFYFFVQGNINNRGFFKNWWDFWLNQRRMSYMSDSSRSVSNI